MPFGDELRQALERIPLELLKRTCGVAEPEVPGEATQECVDLLHDLPDRQPQPGPGSNLPDPVAGILHLGVPGPAGETGELPPGPPRRNGDQAVAEAEEINPVFR